MIGYGLFKKKSKQMTEGWEHRFSRDIKLKKEYVENPVVNEVGGGTCNSICSRKNFI